MPRQWTSSAEPPPLSKNADPVIRILKPAEPPAVLASKGKVETDKNCAAYEADPAVYDSGAETFNFDSGIYGHESVKAALIQTQNKKCCFCESKITHIAYGDVEHFRPKAGYRQYPDDPLGRPKGERTIEALGLRREELREVRFDRYQMLSTLKNVATPFPDDPLGREARQILEKAVQDSAQYASMARSLMRKP